MSDPVHQLESISAMIIEARQAVQEGAYIDLAEIQGLVQEVCASIQQDPPEDGGAAHDKILAMIGDLNLLAEELTMQQKETGADIIRRTVRKSYTPDQDH